MNHRSRVTCADAQHSRGSWSSPSAKLVEIKYHNNTAVHARYSTLLRSTITNQISYTWRENQSKQSSNPSVNSVPGRHRRAAAVLYLLCGFLYRYVDSSIRASPYYCCTRILVLIEEVLIVHDTAVYIKIPEILRGKHCATEQRRSI